MLCLMVSWNVSAWLYLLFLWLQLLRTDSTENQQNSGVQDESASMVLSIVSMACLASILVILFELSTANQLSGSAKVFHLVLTGLTLLVSWLLLSTALLCTTHILHLCAVINQKRFYVTLPQKGTPTHLRTALFIIYHWCGCFTDISTGASDIAAVYTITMLSFIFNMTLNGVVDKRRCRPA